MDLQTYVINFVAFTNSTIIPFLIGIAFLIFIINAIRFFIIGGSNQESQEKARALATYSVLAFTFILVFWGIVNLFSSSLGLAGVRETDAICSDYDPNCSSVSSVRTDQNTARRDALDAMAAADAVVAQQIQQQQMADLANLESEADARTQAAADAERAAADAQVADIANLEDQADAATQAATEAERVAEEARQQAILDNAQTAAEGGEAAERAREQQTAITNEAAAVAAVGAAATAIVQNLGTNNALDARTQQILDAELQIASDAGATPLERAVAATRINTIDPSLFSDNQLASFYDVLDTELRNNGQASLDHQTVSAAATTIPQSFVASQSETLEPLREILTNQNITGVLWWRTDEIEAAAQADAEINIIQREFATAERLRAFDQLIVEKNLNSEAFEITVTRDKLIHDINLQRLIEGNPPLTEAEMVNLQLQ